MPKTLFLSLKLQFQPAAGGSHVMKTAETFGSRVVNLRQSRGEPSAVAW